MARTPKTAVATGRNPLVSGLEPMHPGELLREVVFPGLEQTIDQIAAALRISRNQLYRVMRGANAISPEMALKLGKLCGNGERFWMDLQAEYDLAMARRRLGAELDEVPTLHTPAAA